MKVKFQNLPTNIQVEIISTLYFYHDCHIEHAHGKMSVATSYCLKAKYAEDEWISQEFTKEDLGIKYDGNCAWQEMTLGWEKMSNEEKNIISKAHDIMVKRRAEFDLRLVIDHLEFQEDMKKWEAQ